MNIHDYMIYINNLFIYNTTSNLTVFYDRISLSTAYNSDCANSYLESKSIRSIPNFLIILTTQKEQVNTLPIFFEDRMARNFNSLSFVAFAKTTRL